MAIIGVPCKLKFRGELQKIQNPADHQNCTNSYVASCEENPFVAVNESFHGQSVYGHVLLLKLGNKARERESDDAFGFWIF